MNERINKEIDKLADLEYEYKIAKKECDDKSRLIAMQGRYYKQLAKVEKMVESDLKTSKGSK